MAANAGKSTPPGPATGDTPEDEPEVSVSRRWQWRRVAIFALVLLPLVLAAGYTLDRARHSGRVVRGVHIGDVDVGGMSEAEVARVATDFDERLRKTPLPARVRTSEVSVDPEKLTLSVAPAATARRAMAAGREGGVFRDLRFWIARFSSPLRLPLEISLDLTRARALLDEWEKAHVDLPFSGGVVADAGGVRADPPRKGHVIDGDSAVASLVRGLASWPREPVEVPLVEREPFIAVGAVESAVEEAKRLLAEPVTFSGEGERVLRFEKEELTRALRSRAPTPAAPRVTLYLDNAVVEEKLARVRAGLEAPPVNAHFIVEKGDRVSIVAGSPGAVLRAETVAAKLLEAAALPGRNGPLPLEKGAAPELSKEALAALNVRHLVGQYTTHHPCCQPRVDNIHLIADLLRGQIVKPGESFSVNALIGPRSAKLGFKPAPTIEEGEMVDSLGGGVSQFATTLFNALFVGGYDITERMPHTYWFARYPMGRDATLSWPKPDVAFKNDSEAGALIWTEYGDDHITVKVFGDNGGRKVSIKVSPQQNLVKAPIEYIPDLTQPPEKDKTMEAGQIGWTVFVTRQVTFADGTKREDKRKVVYKARTRRVIVHPCNVPKGEPGYTGEKCPEPEGAEGEGTEAGKPQ